MSRTLDYYCSTLSPWTFIGHAALMDIVRRRGVEVKTRPMPIGKVFARTGGLPLAERPLARRRYRMLELQRWREARGLTFDLQPPHWPFPAETCDRAVIALVRAGADPDAFLRLVFDGIWVEGRDLGDPAVIADCATRAGHDAAALLAAAQAPETEADYARNGVDALEAGVFGAPAYVLDGEVFWGQDRLDLLERALATGRAPYRVPDDV